MRLRTGVGSILAATVIASAAGFAVIVFVPEQVGLAAYQPLGVFWSAMYLVISALSGIQQEVTRATLPTESGAVTAAGVHPSRRGPTWRPDANGSIPLFGCVAALVVVVAIVASAPLWVERVFPQDEWALVWPLAVASGSYVLVATTAGTLYGGRRWRALSLMIGVDALLRLGAVLALSVFTVETAALAWAAAVPFALTLIVMSPWLRRLVIGATSPDVGYRRLTWNVARTVGAAAASGVLVTGLPLVIGMAAADEPPAVVAALFITITLARAPVIVVVTSLQSYLIVWFRSAGSRAGAVLVRLLPLVIAAGFVLAGAAWILAPPVFDIAYSGSISFDGGYYALLVLSSAMVGCLIITAAALLALARHAAYSTGWIAAAAATIGCFWLPSGLLDKTIVALIVGPAVGVVIHSIALARRRPLTDGPLSAVMDEVASA